MFRMLDGTLTDLFTQGCQSHSGKMNVVVETLFSFISGIKTVLTNVEPGRGWLGFVCGGCDLGGHCNNPAFEMLHKEAEEETS